MATVVTPQLVPASQDGLGSTTGEEKNDAIGATVHELGSRDKSVKFYDPPLTEVEPAVQKLLEGYGGMNTVDVLPRILEARDKLWEVFPWPCVGTFRFLEVKIHDLPSYPRVVDAVRSGGRLLDVGSCFGQDLRALVSEPGMPSPPGNVFAIEMESGFLEAAYDFWGDRDRPPAQFMVGDLLDRSHQEMQALVGTIDVVHMSMVLHVWDWDGQVKACMRLVELLKPQNGALILGRKVGRLTAMNWEAWEGHFMYKHDPVSLARLWDEVGERTKTKWVVRAWFDGTLGVKHGSEPHYADPDTRMLMFEVERL